MLKKYCNHTGCNRLIPATESYCEKHKNQAVVSQKEYDQKIRDKEGKRFLNSVAWQTIRKQTLIRDQGLDVYLFVTEQRIVKADHVHHIIPRADAPELALDINNLISLSNDTHSYIESQYRKSNAEKEAMQKKLNEVLKVFMKGRGY